MDNDQTDDIHECAQAEYETIIEHVATKLGMASTDITVSFGNQGAGYVWTITAAKPGTLIVRTGATFVKAAEEILAR